MQKSGMFFLFSSAVLLTTLIFCCPLSADEINRWSVGTGVAVISGKSTNAAVLGDYDRAEGDSAGRVYNLNVIYLINEMNVFLGSKTFSPRFELFSSLGLADEKNRDPFLNINSALTVRWTDFPWNPYVDTTLMTGGGLNYSEKIFRIDIEKHPNEDRSNLKFFWPIELTFALPDFKNHQLVFYNHHFSGGHIMDKGGYDCYGIGYRYLFH